MSDSDRIALVEKISQRLDYLESVLPVPEFVGVAFIAIKMGLSAQKLRNSWWLLPDTGRSESPGRLQWSLKTVRKWLDEKTPSERDREWHRLTPSQQASFDRRRRT